MNLNNFSIGHGNCSIESDGQELDLHNDYAFDGFTYDTSTRSLEMCWLRNSGDWVRPSAPHVLTLAFNDVQILRIREGDQDAPASEDRCLSAIGFMWKSMRDDMDGFAANVASEGCADLLLTFMSGLSIKVQAMGATAIFQDEPK